MCITNFSDDSYPPMNTVELMVSEFLIFYENIELLRSGDCYDLSQGNNNPTEYITLLFVGISVSNQLVWVEVAKYDWSLGTNA